MLVAWIVIAFLILVTALYVAAEFAAVSVRKGQIAQRAEEGNRLAQRLLPRLENSTTLDHYIAACQIGITWSSLVLGAYSQVTLAVSYGKMLEQWAGMDPVTAFSSSSVAVLFLITVLQMVLGELVPKSLALQFSTQTALATVVPMELSLWLYSWFLKFLNGSGHAILKMFGVLQTGHQHVHSPEEIEFLIGESRKGGLLDLAEDQRLRRALRLASRPVRELMIPRRLMISLDVDAPAEVVVQTLTANNYTRVPVYERSPENVIGFLHSKDFVAAVARSSALPSVRSVLRPIVRVAETATGVELLDLLRNQRSHQALVVGDSGVRGLVAVGDLLAELLGQMAGEGRFGQPAPTRLADGEFRLPGLMRIEDASELMNIKLKVNAATVSGLLLHTAGHLPATGEKLLIQGVEFEVEQVEHQAIRSVLARVAIQQDQM
ncbi:MAG: HlyC/CorC family transporter [Bryobacteraceae bacterium]|nr:HlyC/CorC family transporter [Bryobacteraceae bacterium]